MAPRLGFLLLVSAALFHLATSCKLAFNGNAACSEDNCAKTLGNVDAADSPVPLGASIVATSTGGVNYRFFASLVFSQLPGANATYKGYYVIDQKPADYVADCCKLCRESGCAIFRHFPKNDDDLPTDPYWRGVTQTATNPAPAGGWPVKYPPPYPPAPSAPVTPDQYSLYDPTGDKGNCVLFGVSSPVYKTKDGAVCDAGTPKCFNQPQSLSGAGGVFTVNTTTGLIADISLTTGAAKPGVTGKPRSYWGGVCNPDPTVTGDPHFVGADGVRFDFNGQPDKSFCLITDTNLHVNMLIGGYVDKRQFGPVTSKKGNLRSWIIGLSFMWKDEAGAKHTMFLKARKSAEDSRGDGFLSTFTVDGEDVPIPKKAGEAVDRHGMTLTFVGEGKYGKTDMDRYEVRIGGLLAGRMNLRSAHPLLRTKTDAYAHFDLKLEELATTEKVHGVLGQTYRHDASRVVKVLEYKLLSTLLHGTVMHADGETGLGYLDGKVEDYVTSSPTEPDCKFASAFNAE